MTIFIQTRSGLVNAAHVVLISGLCARPTGNYHEIDYTHGTEVRRTMATEEAVEQFLIEAEA